MSRHCTPASQSRIDPSCTPLKELNEASCTPYRAWRTWTSRADAGATPASSPSRPTSEVSTALRRARDDVDGRITGAPFGLRWMLTMRRRPGRGRSVPGPDQDRLVAPPEPGPARDRRGLAVLGDLLARR